MNSGKVVGPFTVNGFSKVCSEVQLIGNEDVQEFPTGSWKPLNKFMELYNIFNNGFDSEDEATFLINLKEINLESEKAIDQENNLNKDIEAREFKFELNDPFENKSFEDKTIKPVDTAILPEKQPDAIKEEQSEPDKLFELDDHNENIKDNSQGQIQDKTIVRKLIEEPEVEKTKINLDYKKYLAKQNEERLKQEEADRVEAERKKFEEKIEIVEIEPDYENDKTEFINIKELKKGLESAVKIEEEFKKEVTEKQIKNTVEEKKPRKVPKKPMNKIFLVALLVAGFFIINYEEEKVSSLKKIKLFSPKISFPARASSIDSNKAKAYYKKGLKQERLQTYGSDLKAAKLYHLSLLNQFDDNPSAARLIFVYSKILQNSESFNKDSKKIYNLVQYFEKFHFKNEQFASAVAYFYYSAGKFNASLNLLDKYSLIEGNKKSSQLFAVYLKVLIEKGDFLRAAKFVGSLKKQKNKTLFNLVALYEYAKVSGNREMAIQYLKEAAKNFPLSMYFLLEKGELFLVEDDLVEVKKLIYKMNSLNVEGSRRYYAKYLKLKGFFHAEKKNYKLAVRELNNSLKIYPDRDLLNRLADGKETDNEKINNLFRKSKTTLLVQDSRKSLRDGNINDAFKHAARALEVSENDISARLNLAEIQLKKGYYDDALLQIKELFNDNRNNEEVLYALVSIFSDMYKFKDANEHLSLIQDKNDPRYSNARAKLYRKKGENGLATAWLSKAIKQDQMNEKNIYQLAKFQIKHHLYKKATSTLNKSMDLNPYDLDYKLSYAKILYEVETSNSAISYLYGVLKKFPKNTRILSSIGIYYYRSGQIQKYENIKEKVKNLPGKTIILYEFLLESAKLDDNFADVIKYCGKIIDIKPGALEIRLFLAQILMEMKKFKKADFQLKEIAKRFSNYPRLSYFNAKFYLLIDKVDMAIKLAETEMKENPNVVDGPLLLGEIYKKKKELIKSKKYYLRAAQIDGRNVDAILGLAFIAFSRDQYDMALDQYQKAVEYDSNRADIYRLLGDTYRKIGQGQIAIKNYKQFLELSPSSSYKRKIETYIRTME